MLKSEFIPWAKGRQFDTDGVPKKQPYQCADETKVFLDKCADIKNFSFTLPVKNPNGYVKSLWENFDDYPQLRGKAVRIKNTPLFVPQLGDIVVWGEYEDLTGEAGHVATATGDNTGTKRFRSLDQNWGKPYCRIVNHNYDGVYGVIRLLLKATITDLNVRSGPGTNYKVIEEYQKGTLVKPLSYSNGWARIGDNMWVSANYLE